MLLFLGKGLVMGDNEKVRTVADVAFPDRKLAISKISLLRFTVKIIEELEGGIEESVIVKADNFKWSSVAVHQCTD
jgi:hypothetical protein